MKGKEQQAYEENLDVCFIVRMPREMRDRVEAHAQWMAKRRHVPDCSLAAASRDLLRRGLMTTPGGHEQRRRERARRREQQAAQSPQLKMWA